MRPELTDSRSSPARMHSLAALYKRLPLPVVATRVISAVLLLVQASKRAHEAGWTRSCSCPVEKHRWHGKTLMLGNIYLLNELGDG